MKLTATTHDLVHLVFPVTLKHLIGLVDDCEFDTLHAQDVRLVHQILETTRSTDEKVAALGELLKVAAHGDTTVGAHRAQHGTVTKTAGLVKDLLSKLTGRNHDDNKRLGADASSLHGGTRALQLADLAHQLGDDRDQISGSLARASLGDSDKIVASKDDGNAVTLDDSDAVVVAELDVGENLRMKTGGIKLPKS